MISCRGLQQSRAGGLYHLIKKLDDIVVFDIDHVVVVII